MATILDDISSEEEVEDEEDEVEEDEEEDDEEFVVPDFLGLGVTSKTDICKNWGQGR